MCIIRALQCLKPSGPQSFQRLAAHLLEDLTESPFRLCASGTQEGIDALSGGIALQMKRYESSLSEAGLVLVADLARAMDDYPDLDVWGLVSTRELPAQYERRLQSIASKQGVCLLVLDAAAARPFLSKASAIEALCAAAPGRLVKAVRDPEWIDPKQKNKVPPPEDLDQELSDIRSQPRFGAWLSHIRDQVRSLPTWFRPQQDLNRQLEDDIVNRSYIAGDGALHDVNRRPLYRRSQGSRFDDRGGVRIQPGAHPVRPGARRGQGLRARARHDRAVSSTVSSGSRPASRNQPWTSATV